MNFDEDVSMEVFRKYLKPTRVMMLTLERSVRPLQPRLVECLGGRQANQGLIVYMVTP